MPLPRDIREKTRGEKPASGHAEFVVSHAYEWENNARLQVKAKVHRLLCRPVLRTKRSRDCASSVDRAITCR